MNKHTTPKAAKIFFIITKSSTAWLSFSFFICVPRLLARISPNDRAVGVVPIITPSTQLFRYLTVDVKRGAIIERIIADGGDTFGDHYACKRSASTERLTADGGKTVG